jgi:hypothetical protein
MTPVSEPTAIVHRNFNVCPHCESRGEDALLSRLSEGIPMISRSDGKNYHLVLADPPLPYPVELGSGPTQKLSVCFWYCYGHGRNAAGSTVVLVQGPMKSKVRTFRQIESIADLLANELSSRQVLASFYNLQSNSLQEMSY